MPQSIGRAVHNGGGLIERHEVRQFGRGLGLGCGRSGVRVSRRRCPSVQEVRGLIERDITPAYPASDSSQDVGVRIFPEVSMGNNDQSLEAWRGDKPTCININQRMIFLEVLLVLER